MAILGKDQMVDALVRLTGENRQSCERVYVGMIQLLHDGLLQGHEFKIHGLGVFTTKLTRSKTIVNPSTGQEHVIPDRLAPTVRWSKAFKTKFKE